MPVRYEPTQAEGAPDAGLPVPPAAEPKATVKRQRKPSKKVTPTDADNTNND